MMQKIVRISAWLMLFYVITPELVVGGGVRKSRSTNDNCVCDMKKLKNMAGELTYLEEMGSTADDESWVKRHLAAEIEECQDYLTQATALEHRVHLLDCKRRGGIVLDAIRSCVFLLDEKHDFDGAKRACEHVDNSHLAKIADGDVHTQVENFLRSKISDISGDSLTVFIGAEIKDLASAENNKVTFLDGSASIVDSDKWFDKYPLANSGYTAVSWLVKGNPYDHRQGWVNDVPTAYRHRPLCQVP